MKPKPLQYQIGLFNSPFDQVNLKDMIRSFQQHGMSCIQFDPRIPLHQPEGDWLSVAGARKVQRQFEDAGIEVAALACYTNLVDPLPERRESGLKELECMIELCREFGTRYITTHSGSTNPASTWIDDPGNRTTETWNLLLSSLARLMRKAEAYGVTLLIEGYVNNVVATTDDAIRLIHDSGDFSALGFVLDPFNYFTRNDMLRQEDAFERIFKAIGGKSPIAHAKDVLYTDEGISTPKVGDGRIDWRLAADMFSRYTPNIPLIFEHLTAAEIGECKEKVTAAFAKTQHN